MRTIIDWKVKFVSVAFLFFLVSVWRSWVQGWVRRADWSAVKVRAGRTTSTWSLGTHTSAIMKVSFKNAWEADLCGFNWHQSYVRMCLCQPDLSLNSRLWRWHAKEITVAMMVQYLQNIKKIRLLVRINLYCLTLTIIIWSVKAFLSRLKYGPNPKDVGKWFLSSSYKHQHSSHSIPFSSRKRGDGRQRGPSWVYVRRCRVGWRWPLFHGARQPNRSVTASPAQ